MDRGPAIYNQAIAAGVQGTSSASASAEARGSTDPEPAKEQNDSEDDYDETVQTFLATEFDHN
eukprot:10472932-Karenia_brevis.AAC.1